MKIDVVTTAIRRPEIFELAMRGYFRGGIKNLPDVRLILNVDPMGDGCAQKVVEIARQYVDEVVTRTPEKCSFSGAINWAWSEIQTDYFLHLEDDWLFTRPVDFNLWLRDLTESNCEILQSVLLRKKPRNLSFKFSFRACLVNSKVARKVLPIPLNADPEKYVALTLGEQVSKDFGHCYQLIDMGRKWAKGHKYRKSQFDDRLNLPTGADGQLDSWFSQRRVAFMGSAEYKLNLLYWRWIQTRYYG